MNFKFISAFIATGLFFSCSLFANSNYDKFQENISYTDDGKSQFVCDDLKEQKRVINEKDCMSALVEYNKQRKAEGKPWCSVRHLHKNKDGCYCFPRVAKGEELTNMCQEKNFYKNDQPVYLGGM